MGGRGGASGINKSANRFSFAENIDTNSLTQNQIDIINIQRADVFRGASLYSKETEPISEPELTLTQRKIFDSVWENGDFSILSGKSLGTQQAIYKAAEYKYDKAQRKIAKGDYDVKSDYWTNRNGKRVIAGTFAENYANRQKAAKIINTLIDYKGVVKQERQIITSTYKRAESRAAKNANGWLTGKK